MTFKEGFQGTGSRGLQGFTSHVSLQNAEAGEMGRKKLRVRWGAGRMGETVLFGDYAAEELGSSSFLENTAP